MTQELVKKPNFPAINIEIQGQNLNITYNLPKDTNPVIFGIFLDRLNKGEYQSLIVHALVQNGQLTGNLPLVNSILEQFNALSKEKVAISPLDVLKNRE